MTMFDEGALARAALQAGARGHLLKRAEQAETERAVRTTAAGEAIFSGEVAAGRAGGRIGIGGADGRRRDRPVTPGSALARLRVQVVGYANRPAETLPAALPMARCHVPPADFSL